MGEREDEQDGFTAPPADEPMLHRAARTGDDAAVRRAASAGADLNAVFVLCTGRNEAGLRVTPLMAAAGSADGATVETVKLLLELGADPKIEIEGASAAAFAFAGLGWGFKPGGDAARAKVLLDAGSPLPQGPEERNEVLCRAAAKGDASRVALLVACGVDPKGFWDAEKARKSYERTRDARAADLAAQPKWVATLPEDMRAAMESMNREQDQRSYERAISAPPSFEIPLFRAAESGSVACVRALLDAGADAGVLDNDKRSALYSAGSEGVVRLLVGAGVRLESVDDSGWTPLAAAVVEGASALPRIEGLIHAGADVNGTHDHGYTVFMSAVGSGRNLEVIRLLVASGADPRAVSEFGSSAFHAAIDVNGEANAEESVRETFTYLKELGVDLEHRNNGSYTPLAFAIDRGTATEVRVLCELGADPNAVCPKHECGGEECTRKKLPLLFHAVGGTGVHRDEKTEALLRAGADVTAVDGEGFSPLAHAVSALCRDAADYEGTYQAFYAGLSGLRFSGGGLPPTRDAFVDAATPVLRAYVEDFAAKIPVDERSEYAAEWRAERVTCIVLLCAYEGWVRYERARVAGPGSA